MSDNGQQTVTLGGEEYDVHLPESFAVRRELVEAGRRNMMRGLYAVIGVCVPGLRMGGRLAVHSYDPIAFGADVWERLHKRGKVTDEEVLIVGSALWTSILHLAYPTEEAVSGTVAFTSGSEEPPTTKPSTSSEPGAETPAGSAP